MDRRDQMNGARVTWCGIGVAFLAAVLVAGTASGELLTKRSISLEDAKKAVVGAIGVSGGKSSEDAQVAKAGIDALATK
ncbi:MAG: heme-binding protein [Syntrophaceae bacterium]